MHAAELEAVYSLLAVRAECALRRTGFCGACRRVDSHTKWPHKIVNLNLNIKPFQSRRPLALFSALVAITFVLLISPAIVRAQDGAQDGTQDSEAIVGYVILGEETAGPHTVQVQVSPAAPRAGISRFAVRVRDSKTGQDIDDAIVRIFGTPSERGEKQYSPALNSPFDPVFYLAQLELEHAGVWAIDIEIESGLGIGTTVLSLPVGSRTRSATGTGWGTALFLLVTLAFVGGASWLWYSSKKGRQRQVRQP